MYQHKFSYGPAFFFYANKNLMKWNSAFGIELSGGETFEVAGETWERV